MSDQAEKIIEKFQSIIHEDLAMLEFWQEFEQEEIQDQPISIDDLVAEIPETTSSREDVERLRDFALKTLDFCKKKRELLAEIAGKLKDFDGI